MILLIFWPVLFCEVFLPGWLLLRAFTDWDEEDAVLLAVPASAMAVGMLGLLGLALGLERGLTAWGALLLPLSLGGVVVAARRRELLPQRRAHRRLLLLWFAATTAYLALQCFIAAFAGGGWYNDWYLSYQISDWYGQHGRLDAVFFDVYTPISRPPLFYILNGLALVRWYGGFDLYQWTATVWNSALFFGVWAWVREWPAARRGRLLALVWLLPVVGLNLLYPWPKGLATGLALLGLAAYRQWDRQGGARPALASGALLGAAYFCHQLALAYVAGLGFHLLVVRARRLSLRRVGFASLGLLLGALISLPWWAWCVRHYGVGKTLTSSPVVARVVDRTGYDLVVTRAYNLAGLVLPENTRRVLARRPLEPRSWLPAGMEAAQAVWRGSLWGNVGLAGLLMLAWLTLRRSGRASPDAWPGWGFILFVAAFAVLVQPLRERAGLAQVALLPLALILFAEVAERLLRDLSARARGLWLGLLVVEFFVAVPLCIHQVRGLVQAGRITPERGVSLLYNRAHADLLGVTLLALAGLLLLALWLASDRQKEIDSPGDGGMV